MIGGTQHTLLILPVCVAGLIGRRSSCPHALQTSRDGAASLYEPSSMR